MNYINLMLKLQLHNFFNCNKYLKCISESYSKLLIIMLNVYVLTNSYETILYVYIFKYNN